MGTKHPFVGSILVSGVYIFTYDPWSKDSLLPMGKIWSLDFLGVRILIKQSSTQGSKVNDTTSTCKCRSTCFKFKARPF